MTSTMAGTPMIQARKYLPMIVLLSFAIDHGFRMPQAGAGVRTLMHGVRVWRAVQQSFNNAMIWRYNPS
jgi:hypothetical protein